MSYNSRYTGKEVDDALDLAKTALQEHQTLKTINGQSILGSGNITIEGGSGGGGGSVDPELLEAYIPMSRDFNDDFNNSFAR